MYDRVQMAARLLDVICLSILTYCEQPQTKQKTDFLFF